MIQRQATTAKPVAFNMLFNVTPMRSCSSLWRGFEYIASQITSYTVPLYWAVRLTYAFEALP